MWWALALAWAEEVCLLTLKAQRGATDVASAQWTERRESLAAWSDQHRKLRAAPALGGSEGDFDFFISKQQQSSDACHAKMLEARRTLDGLHSKVYRLSEAVEANEAIVEAHTKTIEAKMLQKEAKGQDSEAKLGRCEEEKQQALAAASPFDEEMAELRQIAAAANKGSAVQVSAVYQQVRGPDEASLLQLTRTGVVLNVSALSSAQCERAVAALQAQTAARNGTYRQLDCDGTRELLQREFTTSYLALEKLKFGSEALVTTRYEECVDLASSASESAMALLDAQIGRSTELINGALLMIRGVEPLLADAKRSLEKVDVHTDDMRATCVVEGSATEHLQRIRDLIESLEKCPGRHDFMLTKPSIPRPATPAP